MDNKPLYFYHIVDKKADLSVGLLSLKYMYDHEMFAEFDEYVDKYRERIVGSWQIEKYQNRAPESLTREEIIDALKLFRGENGPSYIYFFRYPLYDGLGKKIENLLKVKDIYQIDINDQKTIAKIKEIFYGYDMSNDDNEQLNKEYYERVSEQEYFSKYDDDLPMNFATLNHIAIAFVDDYCPMEFLKKYDD